MPRDEGDVRATATPADPFQKEDFLSRIIFCHLPVHNAALMIAVAVSNDSFAEIVRHVARVINDRKDNTAPGDS